MQLIKPDTNIDFIGKRVPFGIFSAIVVALSILLAVLGSVVPSFPFGPRYGVDFGGGTQIHLRVAEGVGIDQVRQALITLGLSGDSVQSYGSSGREFQIRVQEVNHGANAFFEQAKGKLTESFGADRWKSFDWDPAQSITMTAAATGPVAASEVAARLAELRDDIVVEESKTTHNAVVINYPGLSDEVKEQLGGALGADRFEVLGVEMVGPAVGAELRRNGLLAIGFSLLLILVYVAFRFDLSFAPGAVAALFHDVAITIGVFCLIGHEFSLQTIGALLTIVGYSLNDTIVVYDRIRENLRRFPRRDLGEVINLSLNETLSRTVLTSGTTLLAVVALMTLGGPVLRDFSLALLIGIGVGTYSSIYVASPLIIGLQRWLPVEMKDPDAEDRKRAAVGANYGARL